MSTIAESNEKVAAAQRRVQARQERLREHLQVLKESWGATLTQPIVLGGAVLGGFMLGGGRRATPAKLKCDTRGGPSMLRSMVIALLVPMIERWIGAGRQQATSEPASDTITSRSAVETPVRE